MPNNVIWVHWRGMRDGEKIFDLTKQAIMPEDASYLFTTVT